MLRETTTIARRHKKMSYINPDYYYHKLIMDLTVEKSELKNKVIRLEKKLNQLQKESKQCQK